MKKIIIILVTIVIIAGVAVWAILGRDSANNNNIETVTNSLGSKESKVDEENIKEWGVEDSLTARNTKNEISTMYIRLPDFLTINQGPGKVAYQKDDTLVIMGGQRSYNKELNKSDEIFPDYFENLSEILDEYRSYKYTDFEFDIASTEKVEISGYEMCKYKGIHKFKYNESPKTIHYVAYTTFMKENGAAVYWMVLDESEDQSFTEVIDSHAYKMALSIYEK